MAGCITSTVLLLAMAAASTEAFTVADFLRQQSQLKRSGSVGKPADSPCPAWHPFQCPSGDCVPIKYLCDGSADCADAFDEDRQLCTAATRPPVEETVAFLKALLNAHGKDFLAKVVGAKGANEMAALGGVDRVAVAFSRNISYYYRSLGESPTAEAFGAELGLDAGDLTRTVATFQAILRGDTGDLSANEAGDFKFFVQKLHDTGFF